jgi:hypothetical protein
VYCARLLDLTIAAVVPGSTACSSPQTVLGPFDSVLEPAFSITEQSEHSYVLQTAHVNDATEGVAQLEEADLLVTW